MRSHRLPSAFAGGIFMFINGAGVHRISAGVMQMKCQWQEYIRLLPQWMRQEVDKQGHADLQELRLRCGQTPQLCFQNRCHWLPRAVVRDDLSFVINTASKFSPWAAETIADGFITAPGGHRIGICGAAVVSHGKVTGISAPTSLCIRVAREFTDIAVSLRNVRGSILMIGPPGSGKTTLLRDLVRQYADMEKGSVAVIDQRQELFPMSLGQACFATGKCADIISGCPKAEGIHMALRSMNPTWIAVDEITAGEDCDAMLHAGWCGVTLLATAHAGSVNDLKNRPAYRLLMEKKLFQNVVVLHRDKSWTMERL